MLLGTILMYIARLNIIVRQDIYFMEKPDTAVAKMESGQGKCHLVNVSWLIVNFNQQYYA